MISGRLIATAVFCALIVSPAAGQQAATAPTYALPDAMMTPGAADTPPDVFCNRSTKERRHLPRGLSDRVADAYNVPRDDIGIRYQLDHLVPLAIGGATVAANLWPQPMVDAVVKDRCDRGVQALVCHGGLPLEDARRGMVKDWPAFCRAQGLIP